MTNHNDDASLKKITVTDPVTTHQNQLIAQLMQQIADMKVEIRKTQELANLAITANLFVADGGRPSLHFPSPHQPISTNPPITPVQVFPDAGPSTLFPQAPPPLQNPNTTQAGSSSQMAHATHPPIIHPESQPPNKYNPSTAQIPHPKIPFHIPICTNSQNPHATYFDIDHYEEKDKEWKAKKEMDKLDIKEEIAKAIKQFHFTPDVVGLDYKSLCIHPDLNLPEGFKIPKFDTFNGSGNPLAHLRAYCDQLVSVGKNEALLMRLFGRSLSGEAREWFFSQEINRWTSWSVMCKDFVEHFAYNVEIVPYRYSLEKIKQKSTESYREYAYRWRKNAAKVRPPMTEKEIIEVFVRSQEPEFYERMMLVVGAKFADIVKIGEYIEDGLKTGKLTYISPPVRTPGTLRRRKKDVSAFSDIPDKRRTPSSHTRKSFPQTHLQTIPTYYDQLGYRSSPTNYQATPSHYHSPQYLIITPNYQSPPPNCSHVQPNYQNPPTNYPTPNLQTPPSNYQTPLYPKFQITTPSRRNHSNYNRVPPPPHNNDNSPNPKPPRDADLKSNGGATKEKNQAFSVTFFGEWGDKSQGQALCTTAAVLGGKSLASSISERTVAFAGGFLFIIFGIQSFLTQVE